jgi:hypothetical protein
MTIDFARKVLQAAVVFARVFAFASAPTFAATKFEGQQLVRHALGRAIAPIAIGQDDGDLYMQTAVLRQRGWEGHAKRSLSVKRPDVLSFSRECNGSGSFGIENSLAVNQNYVMYTCWSEPRLFV